MHPDRVELGLLDWKLYTETPALGNARAPVKERSMPRLVLLAGLSVASLSAAAITLWSATSNTGSAVGSGGLASSQVPRLVVHTPGFANPRDAVNADVLLQRIEFSGGKTARMRPSDQRASRTSTTSTAMARASRRRISACSLTR
jgi:hypothetical protein